VLTAEAFAAAVCWWGAANVNLAYHRGASVFGALTASFFLTQQAQCGIQGSVTKQQQQANLTDSGNWCTPEDGHTSSSSSSSSAGSYAELISAWQVLPRHVQHVLLQACSCKLLAAGQVLLDTTSPAAPGTAGAAAGCFGLAAGTVLGVRPMRDAGEAAAAAAAAATMVVAVASQKTVLPRASLTPRAAGAAAAAIGRDVDSNNAIPAMTPRTAAAAAAAGWQAVREHVTSGSGVASSATDMGSRLSLLQHGDAERAKPNAKAEQHSSGSSSSSSAAGSHKWDELSAAVVGPQRMKTAAFKALGWEVSSAAR
jgi:hypothetical protein